MAEFNDQQLSNAKYIYNYFVSRGWTPQAVCGMIGNIQTESMLYADIWEGGVGPGYGLVQWTPASKLIDWSDARGLDYTKISSQCARIKYEMDNGIQFHPTYKYPMTGKEFIKSTESARTLGLVFLANYEQPRNPDQPQRGEQAEYWYNQLANGERPSDPEPEPDPEPSQPTNKNTYTVKSGDTLSGIALKFGVTVAQLQSWNNISDPDKIYVGQVLTIKAGQSNHSETPDTYIIQSGDTLSGIAQKFGVTVSQLQSWNSISNPNKIYVGQKIIVYKNGGGTGTMTYTVKSGDTLSEIAERFGVSVSNLQLWNDISDPNRIYAGQTLVIYSSGGGGGSKILYTIQSGDTLSGIAAKFGVSVSQLQSWNEIADPNRIYAGEVLSIYTSASGGGGSQTYVVKSGDTLSGIAAKFGLSVSQLQSWNNIADPNKIYAGQVLEV